MKRVKFLICEDDPLMCSVISDVISGFPSAEVVGEAGDGALALEEYEELNPDAVIIDIDLPGKKGTELAQEIFDINPWAILIFCTGFADYRDEAFEVYAFDYLVKPFKIERLQRTIKRVIESIERNQDRTVLKRTWTPILEAQGRLLFEETGRLVFVDIKDIIFITKERRKTTVYYAGGKVVTDKTMGVLEEQLRGQSFIRSHRCFLININKIKEIVTTGRYTNDVIMEDTDERPLMTADKLKELKNMAGCS